MMIKKLGIVVIVLSLLLTVLSPSLVQSQVQSITISDSAAKVSFPLRLDFSARVKSDVPVSDIRLRYRIEQMNFAKVTNESFVDFSPAATVDAQWTMDMRKTGGLPPGTNLEYWWLAKNVKGDRLETSPTKILFDDNRYQWRNLSEGKVTIYWYVGDNTFASDLMSTAQQALVRLNKDTGASLEQPARIKIYASQQDLLGAMVFPQEWTGGAAYTEFSIIVIGIPPSSLAWGRSAMTHELTHLVIHQVTFNPYNDLPTWLNEGLAMYNEGALNPQYTAMLINAINTNKLISVRSLTSPFSAITDISLLSYAQSFSLVDYLISQYGANKMLELLNTFKQGSAYDDAFKKVYGFDMDGLNNLWRVYVTKQFKK